MPNRRWDHPRYLWGQRRQQWPTGYRTSCFYEAQFVQYTLIDCTWSWAFVQRNQSKFTPNPQLLWTRGRDKIRNLCWSIKNIFWSNQYLSFVIARQRNCIGLSTNQRHCEQIGKLYPAVVESFMHYLSLS